MPHSLVEVLREIKPRRALFTTYTFNPAFFEAAVLPAAFRPDGCQLRVLVDGGPLASSTRGSYARYIGSRYAVAPVHAPGGGIFHPKLAVLDGDDRQVLCVGSSNLTAAGLAHQLECLDVTDLAAEPQLAKQLREFLHALAQQCMTTSPRAADTLIAAASWLRIPPAVTLGEMDAATLIHTLVRPADVQLAALLRDANRTARTLTVLAPFHSKDGAAVHALRESIQAPALRIGHVGTVPGTAQAYEGASYVSPLEGRGRPLHAKVFEVDTDGGSLVLTGSINATDTSLRSRKNVEVSVARWHRTSPFGWKACEPEKFSPLEQDFGPGCPWTVEANLLGRGQLDALVQGVGSARAEVTWVLYTLSAEIARGMVSLNANGLLNVDLPHPLKPLHDALILHVHGPGGIVATTWVNDQRALRAARDGIRLSTQVGRGKSGSEYLLASDLIMRALKGQPIYGQAQSGHARLVHSDGEGERQGMDEAFNYEDWIRSAYLRIPPAAGLSRRSGAFLTRILELLFPQPDKDSDDEKDREKDTIELNDADPNDEDAVPRDTPQPAPTSTSAGTKRADADREQLLQACQAVREAFETRQTDIASADTLALAVFALDMERAQAAFLAPSNKERGTFDVHRVLVLWFESMSHYEFASETRSELLPVACAIAAATAAVPPCIDPQERHLSQLRSCLHRLAGAPLTDDEVLAQTARGMREEIMLRLVDSFRAAAIAQAALLARAPHTDDMLLWAIAPTQQQSLPESMVPLQAALARWPDRSQGIAALDLAAVRSGGCPICYAHFNDAERRQLRYQRWMLHGSGRQHVLLFPDDRSALCRQGNLR